MPGYTESDLRYFKAQEEFEAKNPHPDYWFPVNNWPLYAGVVNISRFLSIYELIKKVIHLPGHYCELGCWNGTNLVYMAKILQILKPGDYTRIIGFDWFKGLEEFNKRDIVVGEKENYSYGGNYQRLNDAIILHDLKHCMSIVGGNILDTLPKLLNSWKDIRFSFVYFDCDLYEPTKLGLELLWPKLLDGGIMVFDEYNDIDFPGETSAVHEVLGENVELLSVPYTRQPTAYLVKE